MGWINLQALWKIIVFGLIAGAGLPALFAGGLYALSQGPRTRVAGADGTYSDSDALVGGSAVGMVLAAANLAPDTARYHALQSFVELFFTQFPSLLGPGHDPMWRQVNLAAGLPGWHRFPPAQQWLDRNATAKTAKAGPSGDMVTLFSRFLDARAAVVGDVPLTAEQKQNLFDQFRQWQSSSPASGTN